MLSNFFLNQEITITHTMLTLPKILDNPEFLTEKIKFRWDETQIGYFTYNAKNNKLVDTLWLLNHKTTIGITAACSEWIFWRLSKIRIEQGFQRTPYKYEPK